MEIMDRDELRRRLEQLLERTGSAYPVDELLVDINVAYRDIRTDDVAHHVPSRPFFNFTISLGAAVFAIYGDRLELYVLPCDPVAESSLIAAFQRLAMVDIASCQEILAHTYERTTPDLILTPELTARVLADPSPSKSE